jgi:cell division protein FtsB
MANNKNKKQEIKNKIKFIFMVIVAIVCTIWFASYVSNLLFDGKNSLKVYSALKQQKGQLHYNIKQMQLENARLQKEYFELKNLEPEKNN